MVWSQWTYSVAGEGSQYPIFTDNASRVKRLGGDSGTSEFWWSRSPQAASASRFCGCSNAGSAGSSNAYTSSTTGVNFGFCISQGRTDGLQDKLNVFYAYEEITKEQYEELSELLMLKLAEV